MANHSKPFNIPWLVLRAELLGTAALVLVGLSLVILMFGEGSPIPTILPSEGWRMVITGFLFGTTGALIALSPVGERSGAHINPIVTLAFRLMGKLDGPAVISGQWAGWWIYWVGPVIGSVAACVACSALAKRITVAKLYHFDSDRDRLFRKTSHPSN